MVLFHGLADGAVAGLVLGSVAVSGRGRARHAVLIAGAALLSAGLFAPLALEPRNWLLVLLAPLLALAGRWRLAPYALVLPVGLVPEVGLVWAGALLVGLLASEKPLVPEVVGLAVLVIGAHTALIGGAMSLNAGFVEVANPAPRAVLVSWADRVEVVGAGQDQVFWTRGRAPIVQVAPGSPTFQALPAGETTGVLEPSVVDLAEVGRVDCAELAPRAVSGEPRAAFQHLLHRCEPSLGERPGVHLDAARVLVGGEPLDEAALMAADTPSPLSDPDAGVLVARVRLGNPRPAALALVEGSPYDRAVLVERTSAADREVLAALIGAWAEELPESVRGPYDRALEALRGRPGS